MPFANMPLKDLFAFDQAVVRIVAWQQLLLPALVVSLGILLRLPDYIIVMMIVTACSGALFASPAIAALLKLDMRQALHCMLLSTLCMPVSLFLFLSVFHSETVHPDLMMFLKRTAVFLVVPFGLMLAMRPAVQRLGPASSETLEVGARWAMVASLLVFGIGILNGVIEQMETNPVKVVFYFVLTAALAAGMMLITMVVMFRHCIKEAMNAGVVSGFRNIGLGFALVGDMVGPELSVYVGVSMVPVFVAPIAIRFITARTTDPVVI